MPTKDKKAIFDEVWTEERIHAFLDILPPPNITKDFHILLRAYQSMRVDDFRMFVDFFINAGYDLHATDANGRTVYDITCQHQRSKEFSQILQQAMAQKN